MMTQKKTTASTDGKNRPWEEKERCSGSYRLAVDFILIKYLFHYPRLELILWQVDNEMEDEREYNPVLISNRE